MKSVIVAIAEYWMSVFPLSKFALRKIDSVLLMKCLWNLRRKAENLLVQWMHNYYFNKSDVMSYKTKISNSWISKNILIQRSYIPRLQLHWEHAIQNHNSKVSRFYNCMIENGNYVEWRNIIRNNKARPRAIICLCLTCHRRMATKTRLARLGLFHNLDRKCCLCEKDEEDIDHLFFQCSVAN